MSSNSLILQKEMNVQTDFESLKKIFEIVGRELTAYQCPEPAFSQVQVAVDELFGNMIHYAYSGQPGPAAVRLELHSEPRAVELTFCDRGIPFNPLETEDPDITLKAKERRLGGLGIFIVKNTMDDIRYEYKDGQNILFIRKVL